MIEPWAFFESKGIAQSEVRNLAGGDINQVYATDNSVFKINNAADFPEMFKKEAIGLDALRKGIRTPFVLDQGEFKDLQFLEIELIHEGKKNAVFWQGLGKKLAQLHQLSNDQFGFEQDNYIGSLKQRNDFKNSWSEFLVEMRLQPMIEMAVNNGDVNYVESKPIEHFYKRLVDIYPDESPALIHGDLWGGNYLCAENGDPVLIDPAVYYGHREMDIGMMHLFGGFENSIYNSYNEHYALAPNWKDRITINQLYPLLVHVNLFGRSYWSRVSSILEPFKP